MVTGPGGVEAWVDAAEQDPQGGRDDVGQRAVAGREQIGRTGRSTRAVSQTAPPRKSAPTS